MIELKPPRPKGRTGSNPVPGTWPDLRSPAQLVYTSKIRNCSQSQFQSQLPSSTLASSSNSSSPSAPKASLPSRGFPSPPWPSYGCANADDGLPQGRRETAPWALRRSILHPKPSRPPALSLARSSLAYCCSVVSRKQGQGAERHDQASRVRAMQGNTSPPTRSCAGTRRSASPQARAANRMSYAATNSASPSALLSPL